MSSTLPPDPLIDLFVIGAMKAATTTVCDWLDVQHGVVVSRPKEPEIFVSDAAVAQWVPRLTDLFNDDTGGGPGAEQAGRGPIRAPIRVDGSTAYAKFPQVPGVPERVRRHCPGARIVYVMREPISRVLSQYRFDWLQGAEPMPLRRAVQERAPLVDNGRYAFQLRQWLQWFPPEQIILVLTESFSADPAAQIGRVLRHAGLEAAPVVVPERERSNETVHLRRRTLARRVLLQSRVGRRVRPLIPDTVAEAYRRRVTRTAVPTLDEQTRLDLTSIFDADLADLTALTNGPGITCATWNQVVPHWTPELAAR